MSDDLKVLFLATEATPFSKVGGLADIAGALPGALRRLGIDVRLMIPRYDAMQNIDKGCRRIGTLDVPIGSDVEHALLLETVSNDVPVYLVWNDQYFANRERVYGFNDDPQRFTFFSRAAIAAMQKLDWKPNVIHANDWHTAPVVAWLDVYGRRLAAFRDIASLFTIHNLAYQGECGRLILTFAQMEKLPYLPAETPGKVNWMAQGIAHADLVSTSSATYAQEILSEEAGMGLHALLQDRREDLFGILSGIDVDLWNPADDAALTQTFDVESLKMRSVNKTALQRELRLPARPETPVLGMVTRLDNLKGLDLAIAAIDALLKEREAQFVILGTGAESFEARFRDLQSCYPNNVRSLIKFDERLARKIYGSVDLYLVPSRAESASIGLMTAMHYGAVPVVRATGGLTDTVIDAAVQQERATGFVFAEYSDTALLDAITRALSVYGDKALWSGLQRRAMERDFSWNTSARAYVDLYKRATALRRAG